MLGAALLACAPSHSRMDAPLADPDLAGTWQFPNHGVWIRIWPDGQVFQCRTPPSGVPITSRGTVRGGIVSWDEWWPVQAISADGGMLVLDEGGDRRWAFERVSVIGASCAALVPTR